jgi:hypothetical protein
MPAVAERLNLDLPAGLARVTMPVADATPAALVGDGRPVDDPAACEIEIARWPARGTHRFFDRQGAVRAHVSVGFAREFGCPLEAAIV